MTRTQFDDSEPQTVELLDPAVAKLSKDARKAAETLSEREARFLVDTYMKMQKDRIRNGNQVRALSESGEPNAAPAWLFEQAETLERRVGAILDAWSAHMPLGQWLRSIKGIGPIMSSALIAHANPIRFETPSKLWRFAGLDPTLEWKKGEMRPWNASLKRLCWLLGESFVKVSGHADSQYGHIWAARKAGEIERNEAGWNKDAAESVLKNKRLGEDTQAIGHYKAGRLPPAQIHARAKRFAVKVFLVHYWQEGRRLASLPSMSPWVISHGGHSTFIGFGDPIGRWVIAGDGHLDYVASVVPAMSA